MSERARRALTRAWRGMSRRERAGWAGVAALLLTGSFWWPLFPIVASNRAQVALASLSGYRMDYFGGPGGGETLALDPWGQQVVVRTTPPGAMTYDGVPYDGAFFYSCGPNGLDNDGAGDDLVLHPSDLAWARHLRAAPLAAAFLAGLIAWWLRGPFLRRPRDPRLPVELARALVVALGAFVLFHLFLATAVGGPGGALEQAIVKGLRAWEQRIPHVLSLEASFAITSAVVIYAAALTWRLRRPLAQPDPAEAEA